MRMMVGSGRRLAALLSDPRLRRRMGEQGRRHYEERFTLRRMLDQTYAVYQGAAFRTARAARAFSFQFANRSYFRLKG